MHNTEVYRASCTCTYVHNILATDDSLDNEVKSLNPKLQFQLEYLIIDNIVIQLTNLPTCTCTCITIEFPRGEHCLHMIIGEKSDPV